MKIRNKIVGTLAGAGIIAGSLIGGAGSASAYTGYDLGYLRGVTNLTFYNDAYKISVGHTFCNKVREYSSFGRLTSRAKAQAYIRGYNLGGRDDYARSVRNAADIFYC
jgi:hypothetical protein